MVKKIIIAAVIIFVIAGIITAAAVYMKKHKNDHILDGPGMERPLCYTITSCRYYTGGGMEGGSSSIEVYTGEDNKIYLSYYNCPYNGATEESYTLEVGPGALTEIQHMLYSRSFLSWGKLEKSELILLDAPSTTISVTYGDGEMYSVSDSDELPEKGYGIFSEIYYILSMYI